MLRLELTRRESTPTNAQETLNKYFCIDVKLRLTSVSSGAEAAGANLHFGTTLIISSLTWSIISTVLQLYLTITTKVTATSNKSVSLFIGKKV